MVTMEVFDKLVKIRGSKSGLSAIDAALIFAFHDEEPFHTYIAFAKDLLLQCYNVRKYFFSKRVLATGSQSKDENASAKRNLGGWAGPHAFAIALLIATMENIKENSVFIEAGVFKGGTTACLSPVCKNKGVTYIAADTFSGLPGYDNAYGYREGQFYGSIEEVKYHLANNNALDGVEFAIGLFKDTLQSIKRPVVGIFLDTDLYDSSLSALNAIRNYIDQNTLIITDGCSLNRDFCEGVFAPKTPEPLAVHNFLKENNITAFYQHSYIGTLCIATLKCHSENIPYYESNFSIINGYSADFYFPFITLLTLSLFSGDEFYDIKWKECIKNKSIILSSTMCQSMIYEHINTLVTRLQKRKLPNPFNFFE
jgi:hypothetical protein